MRKRKPEFIGVVRMPNAMPRKWGQSETMEQRAAMRVVYAKLVDKKCWVKTATYEGNQIFRKRLECRDQKMWQREMRFALLELYRDMVMAIICNGAAFHPNSALPSHFEGFLHKYKRLPLKSDVLRFLVFRKLVLDKNIDTLGFEHVFVVDFRWELR